MTVCGEKVTGVCVMGKCPHFKRCFPVVWDKYGKIKPKTNEEWRKICSAEEFAEWIATQCSNAVMENTYDVSKLRKKRYWVEWLKKPHQGE